jgi:hypothetical protein
MFVFIFYGRFLAIKACAFSFDKLGDHILLEFDYEEGHQLCFFLGLHHGDELPYFGGDVGAIDDVVDEGGFGFGGGEGEDDVYAVRLEDEELAQDAVGEAVRVLAGDAGDDGFQQLRKVGREGVAGLRHADVVLELQGQEGVDLV